MTRSFTFTEELDTARSVIDLAARLGRVCAANEAELEAMLGDADHLDLCEALTSAIEDTSIEAWNGAVNRPDRQRALLGEEVAGLLRRADPLYPLDCLGVLRGFCRAILPAAFEAVDGPILLDEGIPVPFGIRPMVKRPFEVTPTHTTINRAKLVSGFGHRLFEYKAGESVRVALDYSNRKRIDELMWRGDRGFPRVATIHPDGCESLQIGTRGEDEFFDVTPKAWDTAAVLEFLSCVGDVEIAVLPELSLPRVDALERALEEAPAGAYPPLIVAGSAHLREQPRGLDEIRANEARLYLDGKRIGTHRKCHPYEASELEGKRLPIPLREALSGEPKTITIHAGDHARFAVVICADLNDDFIPQKLVAAGVNTLIVPSFTAKAGAFNGPIADLASRRQGISVIANAPPEEAASAFRLMTAAPRPEPGQQTMTFPRARETATRLAVFDPNQELEKAVQWRSIGGNSA